ncbi:hypothetical protein ACFVSX_14785 [Streptomyces rubiginosohelvolus]|uniref:hypothetical protein n=1 Tax=Streptomyces rubiginosohelvolus TaxID=67362 RepID=UPI0036DEB564
MLGLVSLNAGMALALSNDIIMSSVRPERAGQAAATSETDCRRTYSTGRPRRSPKP